MNEELSDANMSSLGIWHRDHGINDAIEMEMRKRWEEHNLFQNLSNVQKGIVPFQVMQEVELLENLIREEFDAGIMRVGFANSIEYLGDHVSRLLYNITHQLPPLQDVASSIRTKYVEALELVRALHKELEYAEADSTSVSEEQVHKAVVDYKLYLDELIAELKNELGMDLIPKK